MSGKSKKSSAAVDRPFSKDVLLYAKKTAQQYQIILHCEEGRWYGRGLELPNVFGDGKTVNQCMESTREALVGAVALLLERGEKPPKPAQAGVRSQQVNIRLTAEEKVMLETVAQSQGYHGLSDFVRSAALETATR